MTALKILMLLLQDTTAFAWIGLESKTEGFGGAAICVNGGLSSRVGNDLHSAASECLWIWLTRTKCRQY